MPQREKTGMDRIDHELARERIARAMRRHVGPGAPQSTDGVAAASSLAPRTIRNLREGGASRSIIQLLELMDALGPEFVNEVISIAGFGGAHRTGADNGAKNVTSLCVNAELGSLIAMIGAHLEDGTIDHREVREQIPAVRRLHAILGAFLSKYEHPAFDADPHLAVQRVRVA